MDAKNAIRLAIRDECVALIMRSGWVESRLHTRWRFASHLWDDLRQDVYLRFLELGSKKDGDLLRECVGNRQTCCAVVDMTVLEALRMYGRIQGGEGKIVEEPDATPAQMAEELASLAKYLPTKERAIYEQWIDCRYNTQALAHRHNVSKAWMCRYIAQLNRKIYQLWLELC